MQLNQERNSAQQSNRRLFPTADFFPDVLPLVRLHLRYLQGISINSSENAYFESIAMISNWFPSIRMQRDADGDRVSEKDSDIRTELLNCVYDSVSSMVMSISHVTIINSIDNLS